jgi:hypothetical protein
MLGCCHFWKVNVGYGGPSKKGRLIDLMIIRQIEKKLYV